MKRSMSLAIALFVTAGLVGACATAYQPVPSFTPPAVDAGGHSLKTDNVIFILDTSSSMAEGYQQWKKFDVASALVANMGKAMPENKGIISGLLTFGHDPAFSTKSTQMIDGMGPFNRTAFEKALASIPKAGGTSRLDKAIAMAGEDLAGLNGNSALIIVTDGKDMGTGPAAAAAKVKAKYGDALCIYTVQVGDDAAGKALLAKLVEIGGCGFASDAGDLMNGQAMAGFIAKVFLGDKTDRDGDGVADAMDKCPGTPAGVKVDSVGCPLDSDKDGVPDYLDKCPGTPAGVKVDSVGCPLDSDKDGVPDSLDKCPGTPAGTKVDATGCPRTVLGGSASTWTFNDINFETAKATITPASFGILDEIAASLKARPDLKVRAEGFTDNTGARAFNMDLSERRAKAVRDYLVKKGISPSRLSYKGYGPDRPIADNATRAGRAKNRRVQFTQVD